MVGAILTQSTNWKNVERAIGNLKRRDLLEAKKMARLDLQELAQLIRPSGYFNQKALKLKAFLAFFLAHPISGSVKSMSKIPAAKMREMLLAVKGIGPETADSILLYALGKPVFVVDAYTKRVFHRLGFTPEKIGYEDLRKFFEQNLPRSVRLYNDYHAQLVELGKNYCKKTPQCGACPLKAAKHCAGIKA
jgi:endonuclease-3 related protein